MEIQKVALQDANAFKGLFLDYISGKKSIGEFYGHFPDAEGFKKQIESRKFDLNTRKTLVNSLKAQYAALKTATQVQENIDSLSNEKTFTIATGHQLNIFSGPLYFIYKIITAINLCEKLKTQFPEYHFVPVYWMASEDHDFDEISSFHLFGKTFSWSTDQKGAVGRMATSGLDKVLDDLPEKVALFERAYREHDSLSAATRFFVNELFGKYGLVAIDADDQDLKGVFAPVIKDDLLNHHANDLAGKATEKLAKLGYQSQLYPRTINFFYLDEGVRERIVKDGDWYKVKNTDLRFTLQEIQELLAQHPEKFSPNVVLRPLYQEMILPNLAYIGGPAEIAYWLQLKNVFDEYKTSFPILLPRNFGLVVPKNVAQKVEKVGVKYVDLFKDFHDLKAHFLASHSENGISIDKETEKALAHFESISAKAVRVDPTLEGFIAAEAAKTRKVFENIAKRIRRAEEKKMETEINQLENIKNKLFPEGSLQERHDNFLNFYINKPAFIDDLKGAFDPLDFRFHLLIYNE